MKTGGCLCGQIKYEVTGAPLVTHACHCIECQKITGSAYGVNLWLEAKDIQIIKGALQSYRAKGGSGKPHDVYFCADCGSAIYSRYHAAPPQFLFLRSGGLDDSSEVKPDVHIFLKDKQSGVTVDEATPQYEAYYHFKEVWSIDSQQRFKKILSES